MRKIFAVLLAGALVMGACADSGDGGPDPADDPKGALVEAFRDLAEGDGVSMTLSIDSDEASLQALSEDADTPLPEDTAGLILDSSLTVGANNAEDPADAQAEILFELGGEEAAAIVVDGYEFYAHADVPYMLETFGQDPAVIDQALTQLPPGMEFVNQAVENEWIHLTGLEALAQQAEQGGGESAVPNLSEQQQKALDQLSSALEENSEVTEGDEEGPGTHLEAKVDLQGMVQAFEELATDLSGGLTGTEMPTGTEDVPEGEFILDAWVEDGELTQLRVDLLKNAEAFGETESLPEGVEEFGILLGIEEFDGEVDTPDDAVEVSVDQIIGALMGGAFGSTGTETSTGGATGDGTEEICAAVAELPKAQQEAYKDICPDL